MTEENSPSDHLMIYTSNIVSAYVANNSISKDDLNELIANVYDKLNTMNSSTSSATLKSVNDKPAVPIKKSLSDEELICLECGKAFKSIKRHLLSAHGLRPQEYRAKWDLPHDYPMVAPAYAERRSNIARNFGLGTKELSNKG